MSDLPKVTLQRTKHEPGYAMFGALYNETGRRECFTLELPWRDNWDNVSCIPAGEYIAERYYSPKHKTVVFRLTNVPDRDFIEIHIANHPSELLGCIAVGVAIGPVETTHGAKGIGVQASTAAFRAFMADHPEQRFALTVIDPVDA